MELTKNYKMASQNVTINYGDGAASSILKRELSLYGLTNSSPDIIIKINSGDGESETLANNPSIHEELKDGFRCHFGVTSVLFRKERKVLHIEMAFDENQRNWRRKIRNIQYSHPFEDIGQVFHELVLIPSLFFFPERLTLIHGSALEYAPDKVLILAGTGGVGKTSLEMELIFKKGYKFLSDDITFLGQDGSIYPNYAFPKIYAYNTIDNKGMEEKLLCGRNIFDRIQWFLKKKSSPFGVRRRVNPFIFFEGKLSNGGKLKKSFLLFRGNYENFSLEKMTPEKVAEVNLEIIKAEYSVFFNHLYWHNVNNRGLNRPSIISVDYILNTWMDIQYRTFKNCECYLVKVPLKSKLSQFKEWFLSII
jgi:hypothetical protein